MTPNPDRRILIELVVRSTNRVLLDGLDAWLQLGLVSDAWVRQLCQTELSCPLPEPVQPPAPSRPADADSRLVGAATDFLPITATPASNHGRLPNLAQSFMRELSVRWLLFLGVFLVVASSAVIAVSKWQNITPIGQYGILLGYTIAFGVASWLTQRRSPLQLTARTLQIATLLIVPVNFWMIDGVRLWNTALGAITAGLAALLLSAMVLALLRADRAGRSRWGTVGVAIALSWLQLGWGWPSFPVLATYLGTIGAVVALLYEEHLQPEREAATSPPLLPLSTVMLAAATLLLIGRAALTAAVAVNQLGLALGLSGWLMSWLARRDPARWLWRRAGAIVMLVGWSITVAVIPPWQAIAVSGLGGWLLADALQRRGQLNVLITLFGIGLQALGLLWRTVPPDWQQSLIATWVRWAGPAGMPDVLWSLWLFPYVLFSVGWAIDWRRKQRYELALRTEQLALLLGVILTMISLPNPLIRTLDLWLSAAVLAIITAQRARPERPLIYLTHGTAIAAGLATVSWGFPTLTPTLWAALLLVLMVVEWLGSATVFRPTSVWQQSSWHMGLVLAVISYRLLWQGPLFEVGNPGNIWLAVPVSLTLLGLVRTFPQVQQARWLSVVAVAIGQPLMLATVPQRLTSLGLNTLLLGITTHSLRQLPVALLTVGFGLTFASVATWEAAGRSLSIEQMLTLAAIAIGLLWLLRDGCRRRPGPLAQIYQLALDAWATALSAGVLLLLTLGGIVLYLGLPVDRWLLIAASSLIAVALAYRTWQTPSNLSGYALAWSVELLVANTLSLGQLTLDRLAIANLILAAGCLYLGDRCWARHRSSVESGRRPVTDSAPPPLPPLAASWDGIPLLYAGLGLILGHHQFAALTGLYTLAAAWVGIGVGRRRPSLTGITYLAVVGLSAAAYEGLIYQLMQMRQGSIGDGFLLLAALAAGLAILYRLGQPWLQRLWRWSQGEVQAFAYGHWWLGTGLWLAAIAQPLSAAGRWYSVGILGLLALVALVIGNQRWSRTPTLHTFWTAAGIIEALVAIAQGLDIGIPETILQPWAGSIATLITLALYRLPWPRWGWPVGPWHHAALVVPGVVALLTATEINLQSLLLVAAAYAALASAERQIRISYLSLIFTNWAGVRLLTLYNRQEVLWYALLLGGSLLYLAQVDPALQIHTRRDMRHWLRCLATGLICLAAFYQSNLGIIGFAPFWAGLLTILLALGFIAAGLSLRVRAFLYIGTLAFMLQVLWQLWRFVTDYSLLLWALGIALGLILIWIAATFEARRTQVSALLDYWVNELEAWQ